MYSMSLHLMLDGSLRSGLIYVTCIIWWNALHANVAAEALE